MKVMLLAAFAVLAVSQSPHVAHAQEAVSPEAAATPSSARDTEMPPDLGTPDTHAGWYGWQTLMADVGSIGLMFLGGSNGEAMPIVVGALGYLVVTPLILATHDNDWAGGSVLLRLAVPVLLFAGALIAIGDCPLFDESNSGCDRTPGVVVMGGGLLLGAAMPIVDAVLAVDKPRSSARSGVAITPWLGSRADAAGLALSGRL